MKNNKEVIRQMDEHALTFDGAEAPTGLCVDRWSRSVLMGQSFRKPTATNSLSVSFPQ